MKLWVVVAYEFAESEICGVFNSEALALATVTRLRQMNAERRPERVQVEKWTLNQPAAFSLNSWPEERRLPNGAIVPTGHSEDFRHIGGTQ